jgi:predicted lipoprotein with Yx(FWY)xxD motif
MNTKKISIIIGATIILAVSGYVLYTELSARQPSERSVRTGEEEIDLILESIDLTTTEIPDQPNADIRISIHEELGPILVNKAGRTLYTFGNDTPMKSLCYDECAVNWPPTSFDAEYGLIIGSYIGKTAVQTILRDDDIEQAVYKEMPLYSFVEDINPGDANGHNVNNLWFVAQP